MQVRCKRLPYALRTALLQLLLVLHIDVEPHRPLRLPRNIRMLPTGVSGWTGAGSRHDAWRAGDGAGPRECEGPLGRIPSRQSGKTRTEDWRTLNVQLLMFFSL